MYSRSDLAAFLMPGMHAHCGRRQYQLPGSRPHSSAATAQPARV